MGQNQEKVLITIFLYTHTTHHNVKCKFYCNCGHALSTHHDPMGRNPGYCSQHTITSYDEPEDAPQIITMCECRKYKPMQKNRKTRAILSGICLAVGLSLAMLFVFSTHVFSNYTLLSQIAMWQITALIFLVTCSYLISASIVDKVKLRN